MTQVTEILNKPYAQELINSNIPTRLAYTGLDGTPRVIPIATHWNGGEFVACTPDNAPKVPALKADPRVALTIDTEQQPPHILLVRGTAAMEIVDGIPEEYLLAARKMYGAEAMPEFEANVRALYKRMARIAITPAWCQTDRFRDHIAQRDRGDSPPTGTCIEHLHIASAASPVRLGRSHRFRTRDRVSMIRWVSQSRRPILIIAARTYPFI